MNQEQILKLVEPHVPTLVQCVKKGWEEIQSIPDVTRLKFSLSARAGVMHCLSTARLQVAFVGDPNVHYFEDGLLRLVQISDGSHTVLVRVKKLDDALRASNILDNKQLVMDFAEPVVAVVTLGYTVIQRQLEADLNQIYLQQEHEDGKLWHKSIWSAAIESLTAIEAASKEEGATLQRAEVAPKETPNQNQEKASS